MIGVIPYNKLKEENDMLRAAYQELEEDYKRGEELYQELQSNYMELLDKFNGVCDLFEVNPREMIMRLP